MRKALFCILLIISSAGMLHCSNSPGGNGPAVYQVAMHPVRAAWPVMREASGRWEIVGEVVINNTGTEPLVLQAVTIKAFDAAGAVLADRTYGADTFGDIMVVFLKSADGTYSQYAASAGDFAPGNLGLGHVVVLAGNPAMPATAGVTVSFTNGRSETATIPLYEYDPGQQTIWPLSFSGGDWLAWDTGDTNYHWKTFSYNPAINDFVIDQRYAIDAMQGDAQFNISNPFASPNKEDYYAWGEDILSAGSGTVVTVVQDQIDQEISKIWTEADISGTNFMGNYVVVKHGPAFFSLYVHMMRNSAAVSVGDHVATGQVIGKIGNSGLTGNFGTADGVPHLHFQYMDAKDRSNAQGLPALFWNIKINRYSDAELLGALGYLPDIRTVYSLPSGTYSVSGGTPLEYEIITAP